MTPPIYTPATITTTHIFGNLQIEALLHRSGLFAIHPNAPGSSWWAVTHVPTGHAIAQLVRSKQVAQRLVKIALASKVDWQRDDLAYYTEHQYHPDHVAAKQAIKEAR